MNYLIKLKVLQYFTNVGHNSVAPDPYVEAVKEMNHNGR